MKRKILIKEDNGCFNTCSLLFYSYINSFTLAQNVLLFNAHIQDVSKTLLQTLETDFSLQNKQKNPYK